MPVQMERPVVMRSIRNVVVLPLLGALCVGALARAAAAAGSENPILRGTLPERMLDALLPEELPELSYPAYFDDLDKARAQSFAGRYKQSLLTLHQVKDVPPAQL